MGIDQSLVPWTTRLRKQYTVRFVCECSGSEDEAASIPNCGSRLSTIKQFRALPSILQEAHITSFDHTEGESEWGIHGVCLSLQDVIHILNLRIANTTKGPRRLAVCFHDPDLLDLRSLADSSASTSLQDLYVLCDTDDLSLNCTLWGTFNWGQFTHLRSLDIEGYFVYAQPSDFDHDGAETYVPSSLGRPYCGKALNLDSFHLTMATALFFVEHNEDSASTPSQHTERSEADFESLPPLYDLASAMLAIGGRACRYSVSLVSLKLASKEDEACFNLAEQQYRAMFKREIASILQASVGEKGWSRISKADQVTVGRRVL